MPLISDPYQGNHCENNGECKGNIDSYSCRCQPGFIGDKCEEEVDECASIPCQNGGNCTDLVNGFNCTCVSGYIGVTCETDIDECDSNPCEHGAPCTDGKNSYSCDCRPRFSGTRCQISRFFDIGPVHGPRTFSVLTLGNRNVKCFCSLCITDCDGPWTQPNGWTGGYPVVYQPFKNSWTLTLVNGVEIFCGKVNLLNIIIIVKCV